MDVDRELIGFSLFIHGGRRGCGVQFLKGSPSSLAHLAHYGLSLDEEDDQ